LLWSLKNGKILSAVKIREKYKIPSVWELEKMETEQNKRQDEPVVEANDKNQSSVNNQTAA
jgi:hypothetical protein